MTHDSAQWVLLCAQRDRAAAEEILDKYFDVLPVAKRVKLQLAKANLDWVIEQTLEKLRPKVMA